MFIIVEFNPKLNYFKSVIATIISNYEVVEYLTDKCCAFPSALNRSFRNYLTPLLLLQ